MIKKFVLVAISIFLIGCKKNVNETQLEAASTKNDSLTKTYSQTVYLTDIARKEIKEWSQYEEFENIISQYYNTTPSKAMLLSKDLSDIIVKIKDSIKIDKIKRPDVIARFNILNNEALRLNDMSKINTITTEETIEKIENIVYAYESIISKINQVYLLNANEESVDVKFSVPKVLNDTVLKIVKPTETELQKLKTNKQQQ
ncbi:MAG: hypothetical protein KGZ87_09215 [Bacteroidetes bacterium]|nr:hypothetical protein [Bacteroidota bacterium]